MSKVINDGWISVKDKLNEKRNLTKSKRKQGLRLSLHVKPVGSNVIRLATNVWAALRCLGIL